MSDTEIPRDRTLPVADENADYLYAVNDIYATIQGEGCLTGMPMLLVRLHGCPVACAFCDTKETWERKLGFYVDPNADPVKWKGANQYWTQLDARQLADAIDAERDAAGNIGWVLLTGGEPSEQVLAPLVRELHRRGYRIALETSGTATGHVGADIDWVAVSPKIGNPGKRPILSAAIASADEIKMVIGKPADLRKLEDMLAEHPAKSEVTVCLQPMSASKSATAICISECQRRGWRLSIQTHKYIGVA